MAKRYVQVYYDFIHSLTPLSDAERGRLFTAMLEYAGQGTEPDLRGNERFVWPQLKSQIDRDNEKYDEISQVRSEAGQLGGLAKASKRKQKVAKVASAGKPKQLHQDKDKEEDNDKDDNKDEEEDEDKDRAREGDSGSGLLTESEMQSLADGIHTVLDAAKRAGFPDTPSDWDKCNDFVAEYGTDAVLKAIETCTDYTMDKRNWRYLRGILKSDPTGGAKQKPPDKPKGKGYYNPFVDMAYAEMEQEHEQI